MRNKLKLLSLDESPPLSPESPSSAAQPWTELPSDVTSNILQRLGSLQILMSAQLVCTTWFKVCQDPAMWRVIEIIRHILMFVDCSLMCRRAVDRSQGQLADLHLSFSVGDELLNYIVNRSSHLHRLTLESFNRLSGAAVTKAVKKLPELEEFCLLSDSSTLVPTVAISKFMPRLQRLRLRCEMDNMGLEAILDGCPHLESLDLRGCFRVDFGGALGKRCRDQIKDLIPLFSDDYNRGYSNFDDIGI